MEFVYRLLTIALNLIYLYSCSNNTGNFREYVHAYRILACFNLTQVRRVNTCKLSDFSCFHLLALSDFFDSCADSFPLLYSVTCP